MVSDTSNAFFEMLHNDIVDEDGYPNKRPILAHYTSMENLENILRGKQIWMSNPLFMNDLEEVKFGVITGYNMAIADSDIQKAFGSEERYKTFLKEFQHCFLKYDFEDVIDVYVLCFSLHNPKKDTDGRLSMWRGYGNNGKGAALVLDTAKLEYVENSPLVLAPVIYASQDKRRDYLKKLLERVADFISKNKIPDEQIYIYAYYLFSRLCLFAVFTKHDGFSEENEWRFVYFKQRDQDERLSPFLSYHNGPEGLQPKLKFPLEGVPEVTAPDFKFENLIHEILVGPTSSSPFTKISLERMLDDVNQSPLKSRIAMSGIPFRG